MRQFKHVNAYTIEEAVSILKETGKRAKIIAGGTDVIGQMRDNILPDYPEVLINVKTVSAMDYVKEDGNVLKIGALTKLEDLARNELVRARYTILAEAAGRTASPHIREMGTVAGNICQSIRCWYYWVPDNRFNCMRKGGNACYALAGDGRYHSIFGGVRVNNTPCSNECPAGVNIPSYMSKIRDGDLTGAAKILLDFNPLPAITGRVCPHFCESNCNRGSYDESIAIRNVERFIGDYIINNMGDLTKSQPGEKNKSVAIVGSGPTGLSAAYYLRTSGYSVTVFEKMEKAGGLLTYAIPLYRLPKNIVSQQIEVLKSMGIQFKLSTDVGKDTKVKDLMKSFDAVFLACGAWSERKSGIQGEELMISGLDFLRNVNLGTREAPGKTVAVIGGGNVAIDVARTLLRLGTKPVIVYRRGKEEMPAIKEEVEKAEQEGVQFRFLTLPVEVSKKGNTKVLKCVKMKLEGLDKTGRPLPVPIKGSEFTTEFDAVIKAIGEEPDNSIVPAEFLDKNGGMKVNTSTLYSGKNVFAGGDFITGPSTVVAAIASGRKAAGSIAQYLGSIESDDKDSKVVSLPQNFNTQYLKKTSRVNSLELPISNRIKKLDIEDIGSLERSSIEIEANRCFNCGCVAVNPSDMAPVLIVLNARIITTKRVIEAEEFFTVEADKTTVLDDDELVKEIEVPMPKAGAKTRFIKFAQRKSIDFPVVNCAAAIESDGKVVKTARICLNAVYNNPYRVTGAEKYIVGKQINDSTAEGAADVAVANTCPVVNNKYKVQIAKTLVKRAILACNSNL